MIIQKKLSSDETPTFGRSWIFNFPRIWKNESEMINPVRGKNESKDGESQNLAMQERTRKDFHYEFTTMRFAPFLEVGSWIGKSYYTSI